MRKLILASALSATTLMLAACGDGADEAEDTTVVETTDMDAGAAGTTDAAGTGAAGTGTASADWPRGTRIVEEGGTTYRVNTDGTRVAVSDGEWSIVTEGDSRYRVSTGGQRFEINEEGEDLDGAPDAGNPDLDVGINRNGNLDVDVSTDGTDASPPGTR